MKSSLFLLFLAFLPEYSLSQSVTREVYLMGTSCSLTVFSSDRTQSIDLLERIIRNLEATERELSNWQAGSVLTALNSQPVGKFLVAQPSFCQLISVLQHWTNETNRAFDPGIGALIEAWGIRSGGRLPSDPEIKEALSRSGMHLFSIDSPASRIKKMADVVIDCGAFGKGEALDRLNSIDRRGETSWLVNLGGQVAVKGPPPHTDGWDVDIAHPRLRDKPAFSIRLTSGSLSTSGGSERYLMVGGKKVSHILDPRTGRPVSPSGSVSVWHENALVADILSTALHVMGPDEGLSWADNRGFAACYLVNTQSGIKAIATRAFRERFMSSKKR